MNIYRISFNNISTSRFYTKQNTQSGNTITVIIIEISTILAYGTAVVQND